MPIVEIIAYQGRCDGCDNVLNDDEYFDLYHTRDSVLEEISTQGWALGQNNTVYCRKCRTQKDGAAASVPPSDRVKGWFNDKIVVGAVLENQHYFSSQRDGFQVEIIEISEDRNHIKTKVITPTDNFDYREGDIVVWVLSHFDQGYSAVYIEKEFQDDPYHQDGIVLMHIDQPVGVYFDKTDYPDDEDE
jgi:hypothetical protein